MNENKEFFEGMSIDDFDEMRWAWNRHMTCEPWISDLRREKFRREQKMRVDHWLQQRFKEICDLRMKQVKRK